MTFILKYRELVVIAALVLTNGLTLWLYTDTAKEYSSFRGGVAAYAKAQEEHNAELREKSAKITEDTTNGWKAAVDYLRARPVGVLQRACSSQMPGVSGPAAGADGTGESAILTPARIEEDAASDILKLNHLQDWLQRQKALR